MLVAWLGDLTCNGDRQQARLQAAADTPDSWWQFDPLTVRTDSGLIGQPKLEELIETFERVRRLTPAG